MIREKLLTLACAAAILALGACFLPPLGPRQPPPPPRLPLGASRAIRVEATNDAPARHIDPADFSQWIVAAINAQRRPTIPPARAGGEAMPDDAVLKISIVDETVTALPAGQTAANPAEVQLTINAMLTRPDGAIVWRETHRTYYGSYPLTGSAGPWTSPNLQTWVENSVCRPLVIRMLHGEP